MIKEEDLMINDLVYHKIGTLQRVVHITIESFAKQEDDLNKYYDYKDTTFGHLLPIPLTSEILEKNGFKMSEDEDMWQYDDFLLTIDFCQLIGGARWITYKYVHELQHALRLCGLNELADKFKVE